MRKGRVILTIDDVQSTIRSVAGLCDKTWMQLDWEEAHAATVAVKLSLDER